jgi:hypothetical protein
VAKSCKTVAILAKVGVGIYKSILFFHLGYFQTDCEELQEVQA